MDRAFVEPSGSHAILLRGTIHSGFGCTPVSCSSRQGNAVVMGKSLSVVPSPADIVYLDENHFRWNVAWLRPQEYPKKVEQYHNVHSEGGNLVFVDGHARYKPFRWLRSRDFGMVPDLGIDADANKAYTAAF
jgi:prepilin-type processing-associated H-X9-DG protein